MHSLHTIEQLAARIALKGDQRALITFRRLLELKNNQGCLVLLGRIEAESGLSDDEILEVYRSLRVPASHLTKR